MKASKTCSVYILSILTNTSIYDRECRNPCSVSDFFALNKVKIMACNNRVYKWEQQ